MKKFATLLATIVLALPAHAADARGQAFFDRYQALYRTFSPEAADLYCPSALIRNVRSYPTGERRTLELTAGKYQQLVRATIGLAQARGDTSTYSNVKLALEGVNVRITATRYSVLKAYSSPFSLLVGPCNGAEWAVLEELSESQP